MTPGFQGKERTWYSFRPHSVRGTERKILNIINLLAQSNGAWSLMLKIPEKNVYRHVFIFREDWIFIIILLSSAIKCMGGGGIWMLLLLSGHSLGISPIPSVQFNIYFLKFHFSSLQIITALLNRGLWLIQMEQEKESTQKKNLSLYSPFSNYACSKQNKNTHTTTDS